jgi:hypothetical protein
MVAIYLKMEMIQANQTVPKQSYKSNKEEYSRDDIKNWISFGINNGYVNKFKKDEIAKWTDLMMKHGVIKMEGINGNR